MRKSLCVMLLLLSGCATSFQGGAHFPGGRGACQQKCGLQGLSMAGLVYMGEYSSLCEVPSSDKSASLSSGATGGAAVAVMTQMQNAQAATMISTMLIIGMTTGVGLGAGG
jgi:hypothetical protein